MRTFVDFPQNKGHHFFNDFESSDAEDFQTDSQEIPSAEITDANDSENIEKDVIHIRECSIAFSESDKFFLSEFFPRV